ncbi:MAG: tRNA pseudouridine(55) synthase TruB [Prevotella sp.]|nr:tRNA pseudouridine(55) synthase TruB [Prevotella sp.]
MDFYEGVVIPIDKPYRMSSFGALAHIRYLISRKIGVKRVKTGHAGTLDPLATGVLLLCTGKATKMIDQLQAHTKEYLATLKLGATTPSFDREHTVDFTFPTKHITRELVEQTLKNFTGDIMQVPPAYSACKVDGKRAYLLKRKGREVEIKAKPVRVDEIELLDFNPQQMTMAIRVVCGKGTYIRSLARDIGQALHSGAFLTSLRRTRVGDYRVEDCVNFDDFPAWLDKQDIQTLQTNKQENQHSQDFQDK